MMPEAVHPREVTRFGERLDPAFQAMSVLSQQGPRFLEAYALWQSWSAWRAREPDWLSAPQLLEHGRDLEARLARLQGPLPGGPRRRENTGPLSPAADPRQIRVAEAAGLGADHIGPGDVLAYRKLWDAYVMGTARAATAAAEAWDAAAAGTTPATPVNLTQFATPPDGKTLTLWADSERTNANLIETAWNAHADTPDWQLLSQAGDILQDFQRVVLKVGQIYQPDIARDCPELPLPSPPATGNQTDVIAHLEGAGVVAHGLLQLLGIGVGGGLQTLGAIAVAAKDTVDKTVDKVAGALPAIAVCAAAAVGIVILRHK